MKNKAILSILTVLIALNSAIYAADRDWSSLVGTDVVVRVNGEVLTKDYFLKQESLWRALCENKYPGDKAKCDKTIRKMRVGMVDSLIFSQIVGSLVKVDADAITLKMREAAQRTTVAKFGKPKQKYDQLLGYMKSKGLDKEFLNDIERNLSYEAYIRTTFSNELVVTEKDVVETKDYIKRYNARAAATNELTVAQAVKIRQEAINGADFAELVKKYSCGDDFEEGGDLGDCFVDDFPDYPEDYWPKVSKLKPGEVSELLTTPSGYEIVKNTGDKPYNADDGIHLCRIFLRRPYMMKEMSREDIIDEMKETKNELVRKKAQYDLRKRSRIEYPFGRTIFENWSKSK